MPPLTATKNAFLGHFFCKNANLFIKAHVIQAANNKCTCCGVLNMVEKGKEGQGILKGVVLLVGGTT
jgi:hypothetical protein